MQNSVLMSLYFLTAFHNPTGISGRISMMSNTKRHSDYSGEPKKTSFYLIVWLSNGQSILHQDDLTLTEYNGCSL